MLHQPTCRRGTRADRASDQDARAAADQTSDEHTAAGSSGDPDLIPTVVSVSCELAFVIDVRALAHVGVNQHCVQRVPFAGRQDNILREESYRWLSFDAAWLVEFRNPTFYDGPSRKQRLAVNNYSIDQSPLKRVADMTTECEIVVSSFTFSEVPVERDFGPSRR